MQAVTGKSDVKLYTRNGLNWASKFPSIAKELKALKTPLCIYDGEIVALDKDGKSNFQLLQRAIKGEVKTPLYFFLFDILFSEGEDLRALPLWERKQQLKDKLEHHDFQKIRYSDHITEHGTDFFTLACQNGLEGVVSKEMNSPYTSGRSSIWIKRKCIQREEFIIGGWSESKIQTNKIGSLLLGYYRDNRFYYAGRVGTGFNQKDLSKLYKDLKPQSITKNPFEVNAPKGKGLHWVEPQKIVEIKFQEWTEDKVLRGAVYLGEREDKIVEEMKMETNISSPDKVIFKKEKITKEEVALYYQKVSKEIFRLVRERPLMVARCPNGTSEKCFYQKHLDSKSFSDLNSFKVEEKHGLGEYFSLKSSEGLLELVQMNAYEFHAWNSRDRDLDHPDQIIFDLDPGPGVSWNETTDGAFLLKEILDSLDLESFVKVTGGKGIHIHVPIKPKYSWEQVKSFAFTVSKELANQNPKKFTTNMSKKVRGKKIFIDYFRNNKGATAVIPYSLRVKEKTAVALPLEWNEISQIKSSSEFSLEGALEKIATRKSNPWIGYNRKKQLISIFETSH